MHTISGSGEISRLPVRVRIREVRIAAPFHWLSLGAQDLRASTSASLPHGIGMVLLGWLLLIMLGTHPYFVAAVVTGFLLVAPVMATGLCELSRRREAGESLSFDVSLAPLRRDRRALFEFGAVLALIAAVWLLASEAMLAAVVVAPGPTVVDTLYGGFGDRITVAIAGQYVIIGLVLAVLVFGMSVIAVPVILDRRATAGEGVRASLEAVRRNPAAMLVWGSLLVLITAIGFATLLVGMIVVIPLLGHASWHAYRDLATP